MQSNHELDLEGIGVIQTRVNQMAKLDKLKNKEKGVLSLKKGIKAGIIRVAFVSFIMLIALVSLNAATVTYQAENASYGGSTVTETKNGGYNGTAYLNFSTSGGYAQFNNVDGGAGGAATLQIRNALGVTTSRTGRYQVNGGTWQNITFNPTGAWTTWVTTTVNITLNSGTGNTIRLESTGQDLANIDEITVVSSGLVSTPTPTTRVNTPTPTQGPGTPTPTRGATPTPTKAPTATPSVSYNVVVAKDGSGNYSTVSAAISAVPDNNRSWYKIYIKNGTYREVITVSSSKTYVWLIGQSNTGTILTYNNCSDTAGGTTNSASFFAKANNFKAENLTFENAFDYNNSSYTNKQAVALEPYADRQTYTNCRITGWQDTLFVRAGRQYFKNCYISGVVDFIFGEGTAVFDQCEIRARSRSSGCFSAPSTLSTSTYGLVFLNCTLTADSGVPSSSFWLGRPWHPSSSTGVKSAAAYLYCNMGSFVQTNGWTSMSGVEPSTERLREYKNTGSGAVINSSRPQLSDSEAANYNVTNILKGSDNWNPTNY